MICFLLSYVFVSVEGSVAQAGIDSANISMGMCEDSEGCSLWEFKNGHATGRWGNGAVGDLTIEHLTASSVTIHRKDTTGAATGWRAVYNGSINGAVIEGTLEAYTPKNTGPLGHPDATTKWHAIIRPDLKLSPFGTPTPASASGWIECEDVGDGCVNDHPPAKLAWALGMPVDAARDLSNQNATILLKVDSNLPNQVVIRRIDLDGRFPGLTAIYTGVREGSVMRGKGSWMAPGLGNVVRGTWVARLVPRTCSASGRDDSSQISAFDIATTDFMLGDKPAAVRCLQVGADKGDVTAQRALAQVYYSGDGVAKDMAKALALSKSMADHGDLTSMHNVGVMYKLGQGTPVDTLRAGFYFDLETMRRQELQDEGNQQRATNGFEALDAMLTSAFLKNISFQQQALSGRLEHRSDVIQYLNRGQTRVQAEENARRDEIESRQKDLAQCRERHKDDYAKFQQEEAERASNYRKYGRTPVPGVYKDACFADAANFNSFESGSEKYLDCVHKYVESEAIEAHCTY